jgi:hypothetical protein
VGRVEGWDSGTSLVKSSRLSFRVSKLPLPLLCFCCRYAFCAFVGIKGSDTSMGSCALSQGGYGGKDLICIISVR